MAEHNSSSGGGNVSHGDDIAELRALLADGGLTNGVLEGKFLNQVRRTRHLTVQLESEKTRARQLEAQLAALPRNNPNSTQTKNKKSSDAASPRPNPRALSDEDSPQSLSALRERLDRAYAQLHEAKRQLEEQRREAQRMRRLLQREIGGAAEDVDALLQNAQNAPSSSAEISGWRGRAQQIVVLKSRVKELQRALTQAQHNNNNNNHNNNDNNNDDHNNNDGDNNNDSGNDKDSGRNTSQNRICDQSDFSCKVRDVDDAARERVAAVQCRRQRQRRELQAALDRRAAEVDAQRRRADAAAARHTNLEANNQTLREYLQSLVRKTENDNDLIDAYREELAALRGELQEARGKVRELEQWQQGETAEQREMRQKQKESEEQLQKEQRRKETGDAHALDNGTAVALAGADAAIQLHRLKMENAELRQRLHGANEEDSDRNNSGNNNATDAALVLHWLRSVAGESATAETAQWPTHVADVLRRAHDAVRQMQQEREKDAARLSQCYDEMQRLQKRQHRKGEEGGEETGFVQMVLQENHSLKKRLQALQKLMEHELKAYESLWSTAREWKGE